MKETVFQRVLSTRREFALARRQVEMMYALEPAGVRHVRRTWFDTFDERLTQAGYRLELDDGMPPVLRLCGTGAESGCSGQPLPEMPGEPLVPPAGALRDQVDTLRGTRALLARLDASLRVASWRIMDGEGKLRGFLEEERYLDGGTPSRGRTSITVLKVRALRGYEKSCRRLMADLAPLLTAAPAGGDPFDALVATRRRGRRPESPVAGLVPPVPLRPRQSAARALSLILLGQLRIIDANLDGVRADIDDEFLHDFRVACRRSRSLLTQIKDVFPGPGTAPFRDHFAWLSRVTSPRRDLDVFLAALPVLAGHVTGRQARALMPLHELLLNRRRAEHERLREALESARFARFLADWQAYLAAFTARDAPRVGAGATALSSANRTLARLFNRVLREGQACGAGEYSVQLHELRKDCKKLRYVLEAYRSLYPAEPVDLVVRRLRKLQGVLGEIVDCHVQCDWLEAWCGEVRSWEGVGPDTLDAMGALEAHVRETGLRRQKDVMRRFEQFAGTSVREAMDTLLGKRR